MTCDVANESIVQGAPHNVAGGLDVARGMDSAGSILTPGGVQVCGVVVDLGDADSDPDPVVSSGPVAWWTFWYVPIGDTMFIYILICVYFNLFREETRLLRFTLAGNPDFALQHKDISSWSDEVCFICHIFQLLILCFNPHSMMTSLIWYWASP